MWLFRPLPQVLQNQGKETQDDVPVKSFSNGTKKPRSNSAEEVDYIFHLDGEVIITCTLGGAKVNMLIDSGSKCNIICDATWEILKTNKVHVVESQVKCPDKKFMAYASQNPLVVLCSFVSTVMVGNGAVSGKATFYVIKNGTRNLLGKDTATKMGMLKLGFGAINQIDGVNFKTNHTLWQMQNL